jgi:hypothetical protein
VAAKDRASGSSSPTALTYECQDSNGQSTSTFVRSISMGVDDFSFSAGSLPGKRTGRRGTIRGDIERDGDPGETGFWILNGESRLYARLERVDVKQELVSPFDGCLIAGVARPEARRDLQASNTV